MAHIDGSIDDPTPTSAMADRADCYIVALRLLLASQMKFEADDVLYLTQFLAGDDF